MLYIGVGKYDRVAESRKKRPLDFAVRMPPYLDLRGAASLSYIQF